MNKRLAANGNLPAFHSFRLTKSCSRKRNSLVLVVGSSAMLNERGDSFVPDETMVVKSRLANGEGLRKKSTLATLTRNQSREPISGK